MSDLRHDPIDDIWITVANHRRDRPMEFVPIERRLQQLICPFCKGNESETPRAIAAYRKDGSLIESVHQESDWLTRVCANKYPAYSTQSNHAHALEIPSTQNRPTTGPFQTSDAPGVQELIIPTPRHVSSLAELNDAELELSFSVHQERLGVLESAGQQHGMLFLNCRASAGASLAHLHWQLIGSPVASNHLIQRSRRYHQYRQEHDGQSLLYDLLAWEIESGARILEITEHFCILCPFASRFPFQIAVIPRDQETRFVDCCAEVRNELAMHCRDIVKRLEMLLDDPAYNVLLQQPLFEHDQQDPWYVEIFPRLTVPAGYEWGSGIWINPVSPETAARALRAAEESRRTS